MKIRDLIDESAGVGRIVKGVNTTADVGPDELVKQAAKFGNVVTKDGRPSITRTDGGDAISEKKSKPTPTNPALWGRAKAAAKRKFEVYPSAYANAWASKWYKKRGGGWRMS